MPSLDACTLLQSGNSSNESCHLFSLRERLKNPCQTTRRSKGFRMLRFCHASSPRLMRTSALFFSSALVILNSGTAFSAPESPTAAKVSTNGLAVPPLSVRLSTRPPAVALPSISLTYDLIPIRNKTWGQTGVDYGIPKRQVLDPRPRPSEAAEFINAEAMRRFQGQWEARTESSRYTLYPSRIQELIGAAR
jgi:hypothetical protein